MDYKTKADDPYPELFNVLGSLSKGASWLFWSMADLRNKETNIIVYRSKSKSEACRIARAYKELHELSLIKRIRKQIYILNPAVLIPQKDNYLLVKNKWDSLP